MAELEAAQEAQDKAEAAAQGDPQKGVLTFLVANVVCWSGIGFANLEAMLCCIGGGAEVCKSEGLWVC